LEHLGQAGMRQRTHETQSPTREALIESAANGSSLNQKYFRGETVSLTTRNSFRLVDI